MVNFGSISAIASERRASDSSKNYPWEIGGRCVKWCSFQLQIWLDLPAKSDFWVFLIWVHHLAGEPNWEIKIEFKYLWTLNWWAWPIVQKAIGKQISLKKKNINVPLRSPNTVIPKNFCLQIWSNKNTDLPSDLTIITSGIESGFQSCLWWPCFGVRRVGDWESSSILN